MRSLWRISCPGRRLSSPLSRTSIFCFTTLDSATKIEEELLPHYNPYRFYPIRIGDVYGERYQVLSKLGFGSNSTVWFCRDLKLSLRRTHQHVALKVCISSQRPSRELEVLKHLATTQASNAGAHFVMTLLDSFVVQGQAGSHQCLVMEPLLASLHELQQTLVPKSLTEQMLRTSLQQVFAGLDYLHTEAKVVHTDLQAKNIMLSCSDPAVFETWEQSEIDDPSPRKVDGDRVIYRSREFNLKRDMRSIGRCIITDFGMARIGLQHEGFIQPETSAADIWNVGVLIWDLFEGDHLFYPGGSDRKVSNARMLGEMIALLGPPPSRFLQRADETLAYWNHDAEWKGFASIPEYGLEDVEVYLEGKNKELFMAFMRKMLQWEPEKRASAISLLQDEWLNS